MAWDQNTLHVEWSASYRLVAKEYDVVTERNMQCSDSGCDQMDGDNVNWHIVNPTTPAQYFHLVHQQVGGGL